MSEPEWGEESLWRGRFCRPTHKYGLKLAARPTNSNQRGSKNARGSSSWLARPQSAREGKVPNWHQAGLTSATRAGIREGRLRVVIGWRRLRRIVANALRI